MFFILSNHHPFLTLLPAHTEINIKFSCTEYVSLPLHGSQPRHGDRACVLSYSKVVSQALQGHPRWIGHSEEY